MSDRRTAAPSRSAKTPHHRFLFGAIALSLFGGTLHSLITNWTWLTGVLTDLGDAEVPRLGLPGSASLSAWLIVVVMAATASLGGWWSAGRLLAGSSLADDRPVRLGMSVVVANTALGLVGTVAVVLGTLDRWFLIVAIGLGVLTAHHFRPRTATTWRRRSPASGFHRPTLVVAAIVIPITLVVCHSLLAPVTEWDSMIYHAARPRLWFDARPAPPLVHGPSIGLEISDNYPPLHAAIGAVLYTVAGVADDTFLRLLSPVLGIGVLGMVYGYARHRLGQLGAALAVIQLIGAPLFLMYTAWPTYYILLAATTFAFVLCCDLAREGPRPTAWCATGVAIGMCGLTGFLGWLTLPIGVVVALSGPATHRIRNAVIVGGTAFLVASPWLLRNLIRLHDPLYPLGTPPLHGRGLDTPLWDAAKSEVRTNALGYWGPGWRPGQFLGSLAGDRHLLAVGSVAAVLGLLAVARQGRRWGWLAAGATLVLLAGPAIPGWFWIRSLVPALPVLAIGAAAACTTLLAEARAQDRTWGAAIRQASAQTLVGAATVLALTSGVLLAVAGPNQSGWTTGLPASSDFVRRWNELGGPRSDALWTAFRGDAESWDWIDDHLAPGERLATFDVRVLELDHPETVVYLDGREADPLRELDNAGHARRTLARMRVRFVVIPSWAVANSAVAHPAVDLHPWINDLGGTDLPLVAVFAAGSGFPLTSVYEVGGTPTIGAATIRPGAGGSAPAEDGSILLPGGRSDSRVFAFLTGAGPGVVELEYHDTGHGRVDLNLFAGSGLALGAASVQRSDSGQWCRIAVDLVGPGPVEIGVNVDGGPLRVRSVRARSHDNVIGSRCRPG